MPQASVVAAVVHLPLIVLYVSRFLSNTSLCAHRLSKCTSRSEVGAAAPRRSATPTPTPAAAPFCSAPTIRTCSSSKRIASRWDRTAGRAWSHGINALINSRGGGTLRLLAQSGLCWLLKSWSHITADRYCVCGLYYPLREIHFHSSVQSRRPA